MSYRIKVKKSAAKTLKKIPKADLKRVARKIDSLAESLPNPDTTKMSCLNSVENLLANSPVNTLQPISI